MRLLKYLLNQLVKIFQPPTLELPPLKAAPEIIPYQPAIPTKVVPKVKAVPQKPWHKRRAELDKTLTEAEVQLGEYWSYGRAIEFVRATTGRGCSRSAVSRWRKQYASGTAA